MFSLIFYVFAALTAGCALGVVLNKNTVHASFCLLLSLLGTAGIFVLLDAYLLAALLVLVYAGAVAALFVFIVMLIGGQGESPKSAGRLRGIAAVLGFALLCFGAYTTFGSDFLAAPATDAPALGAQLKLYAYQLFTIYLLPVQVSAFLLLIAMVGVIVVSKSFKKEAAAEQA